MFKNRDQVFEMKSKKTSLRYYSVSIPQFEVKRIQKHISYTAQEIHSPFQKRLVLFRGMLLVILSKVGIS
jgi:hypothetical protein